MMVRQFHLLLLIGLLAACCDSPMRETVRPNVVLFYVDDLGWMDVGYMGNADFLTPAIDAFAERGLIFTDAYSSAPVCAPARASLMIGQHVPRHGIYTVRQSDRGPSWRMKTIPPPTKTELDPSYLTLAEVLKTAGYRTAHVGKWHLGDGLTGPTAQGFDINVGGSLEGMPQRVKGYFSPYDLPHLINGPEGEFLAERLTREALEFIEANRSQPFFLFLSHYSVHVPIEAPPRAVERFRVRGGTREPFDPIYAAMVESVDQSFDSVVKKLEQLNLLSDTLVIFYSDNGGWGKATSCRPLRGCKGMLFEGGIRVPAFMHWPNGITRIGRVSTPIIAHDLFPTILSACRIPFPEDHILDGQDLTPLLKGEAAGDLQERSLFWHFPCYMNGMDYPDQVDWQIREKPSGAIRSGRWKLIERFETGQLELYDLIEDIGERQNLAATQPEIAIQLLRQLRDWRSATNAPVPQEANLDFNPDPDYMHENFKKRLERLRILQQENWSDWRNR